MTRWLLLFVLTSSVSLADQTVPNRSGNKEAELWMERCAGRLRHAGDELGLKYNVDTFPGEDDEDATEPTSNIADVVTFSFCDKGCMRAAYARSDGAHGVELKRTSKANRVLARAVDDCMKMLKKH